MNMSRSPSDCALQVTPDKCEMPVCRHTSREFNSSDNPWQQTVDHIVPFGAPLGTCEGHYRHVRCQQHDSPTNLRPAHRSCNSAAGGVRLTPKQKRAVSKKRLSRAEVKANDTAVWSKLFDKAVCTGACLGCLRVSAWRKGRPKFVKHIGLCPHRGAAMNRVHTANATRTLERRKALDDLRQDIEQAFDTRSSGKKLPF